MISLGPYQLSVSCKSPQSLSTTGLATIPFSGHGSRDPFFLQLSLQRHFSLLRPPLCSTTSEAAPFLLMRPSLCLCRRWPAPLLRPIFCSISSTASFSSFAYGVLLYAHKVKPIVCNSSVDVLLSCQIAQLAAIALIPASLLLFLCIHTLLPSLLLHLTATKTPPFEATSRVEQSEEPRPPPPSRLRNTTSGQRIVDQAGGFHVTASLRYRISLIRRICSTQLAFLLQLPRQACPDNGTKMNTTLTHAPNAHKPG
ncbi:hypothetical protein L7F22_032580 [Adiantum nelumboides]|nr:hypothetical protein [Adiantum nelumboides]